MCALSLSLFLAFCSYVAFCSCLFCIFYGVRVFYSVCYRKYLTEREFHHFLSFSSCLCLSHVHSQIHAVKVENIHFEVIIEKERKNQNLFSIRDFFFVTLTLSNDEPNEYCGFIFFFFSKIKINIKLIICIVSVNQ